MKSKLALAIALVLGGTGGLTGVPASAASFGTGGSAQMDQNGDGYLTMNEIKGHKELMAKMDKMDKNNDHKLDKAEFSSFATGGNL